MTREEAYLEQAIARYPTQVAKTARAALKRIRARFPGVRFDVYERRGSLPIGLAPAGGGGALMSVVLYPRWVRFFFREGAALNDPEGRLEGTGNVVRSIRLDDDAAILEDPYVRGLIAQAQKIAGKNLSSGSGAVTIKSKVTGRN